MTRVLLVTGSRSLANHPGAEAWARGLIHAALVSVDLLIVGDAPGPDAWAADEASPDDRITVHRYITRGRDAGWIVTPQDPGDEEHFVSRWAQSNDTHPLKRNAAMVRHAAVRAELGRDVRVLALLDGTKRDVPGRRATRGTEHTAGLAERAGIVVQREVWNG